MDEDMDIEAMLDAPLKEKTKKEVSPAKEEKEKEEKSHKKSKKHKSVFQRLQAYQQYQQQQAQVITKIYSNQQELIIGGFSNEQIMSIQGQLAPVVAQGKLHVRHLGQGQLHISGLMPEQQEVFLRSIQAGDLALMQQRLQALMQAQKEEQQRNQILMMQHRAQQQSAQSSTTPPETVNIPD